MENLSAYIVCHECDMMHRKPVLQPRTFAKCSRCGNVLARYYKYPFQETYALILCSAILLVVANSFSFLSFSVKGIHHDMTLISSIVSLYEYDQIFLALVVAAFIFGVPAVCIGSMLYILTPLLFNQRPFPLSRNIARLIFKASPWGMLDVFLLGAIVTLVKLGGMAKLFFGMSFWAYVALVFAFTGGILSLDQDCLWDKLNPGKNR